MKEVNLEFTILCDDLTGSSVQSILLKERGFSPTLQVRHDLRGRRESLPEPRILVVNINTRGLDAESATSRVKGVIGKTDTGRRLAKRIDTTLRGHLYAETACLLESRPGSVALVVPAYPASGRTTIGGYQLLHGSLLERTEVAKDPVWPISTSYVPEYFQGKYSLSLLPIEPVEKGVAQTVKVLAKKAAGSRIIIADAQTGADIEVIAEAAASLEIPFIPVDPGPFTAAYVYHTLVPEHKKTALAIIGSTSNVTKQQLEYLEGKLEVAFFRYDAGEETVTLLKRCEDFMAGLQKEAVDLVVIQPGGPILKGREEELARQLALLSVAALSSLEGDLSGLILSGGDTAMEFLDRLDADFIEPVVELAPLMMGGRIKGTSHDALKVVTKGGLVGGLDGLYRALQWLRLEDEE